MSTLTMTGGDQMAKKRGNPGKPLGEGRAVRLDPAIVSMAKILAGAKGVAMGEYLSDMLRAPIAREYAKVMEQLQREGKRPAGPRGGDTER